MPTDLAVNPQTGEVLEHLGQQPPEALAWALVEIHARQAEMKLWSDALETELRRRLKVRGARVAVFGDWEVEATRTRQSDWDLGGLEPVLEALVEEGVVRAADVTEVITREPVISRKHARQLMGRLTGEARAAVEACCTWRETAGKLIVTRSVELSSGEPEGVLSAENAANPVARRDADRTPSAALRRAEPFLPAPDLTPPPPTILDPTELFR
jgi:hypothetical protein